MGTRTGGCGPPGTPSWGKKKTYFQKTLNVQNNICITSPLWTMLFSQTNHKTMPFPTTDRISTDYSIHHVLIMITILVFATLISQAMHNTHSDLSEVCFNKTAVVSVCMLVTVSPRVRPHTAAAPGRYTLCWTDEPSASPD